MARVLRVLAAVALLVAAAACSRAPEAATVRTHWLRVADGGGDVPTLNPHIFNGTTVHTIALLTMAYLFRYDANARPQPELATELPTQSNGGISADGRTIVFHLRRGVRWSDGAPFTADDVVFSTRAVLDPANDEITRAGWDLIDQIREPDKYTVVFHLKRPYALFEPAFFGAGLASPCILPKHLLDREPNINHVAYNDKPVGIGPFRVVSFNHDEAVELEANPFYFRGQPKLKHVTFRLIRDRDVLLDAAQSGDIDLWPSVPPQYIAKAQAIKAMRTIVVPGGFWSAIFFNVTRPLVRDRSVRAAIRLAIDRPLVLDQVVNGNGILQDSALSPAVPVVPADLPVTPFDPTRAQQLLEAAGWRAGADGIRSKDGRRLALTLAIGPGFQSDFLGELMRRNLKSVGIALQVRHYPNALLFASYGQHGVVMRGDWDMTSFAWDSEPNGSLENVASCTSIPPNGQNIMRFCEHDMDVMLWRYTMTYGENERRRMLAVIERELIDEVPFVTLYAWKTGFTFSPKLEGYAPGRMAPFGDPMQLDI